MNAQSLIPTPNVAHADELATAYNTLQEALANAAEAESVANAERSNLCEDPDFLKLPEIPEDAGYFEKRRLEERNAKLLKEKLALRSLRRSIYYGCRLRVVAYTSAIDSARLALVKAIGTLRALIDANDPQSADRIPSLQLQAAIFNAESADRLCFDANQEAARLDKIWEYGYFDPQDRDENMGQGKRALLDEYERLRREWVVMCSGHGSDFIFDTEDRKLPEGPYLTVDEATQQAIAWILISDTIGGDALIYNVRTLERRSV